MNMVIKDARIKKYTLYSIKFMTPKYKNILP